MSKYETSDLKIEDVGIIKRVECEKVEVRITIDPCSAKIEMEQFLDFADVEPDTMDKLLEGFLDILDAEILNLRKKLQDKQSQKEK